jgi:undecaprenyl diphosphate synthase
VRPVTRERGGALASGILTPEELRQRGDIPRHIAIIMDGNGRWARSRGVARLMGHRAGREAVREAVKGCVALGVEVLSLYTFSIENWNRPRREVQALMTILRQTLRGERDELDRRNVRLQVIGRSADLPEAVRREIQVTEKHLSGNTGLLLLLALSYSGRAELVDAVRHILEDQRKKPIAPASVDEELVSSYLYTAGLPDPDLLIRTSGEMRISNFLLWQLAYTELWITDTLWPDFRRRHLYRAVAEFQTRDRRFGRVD